MLYKKGDKVIPVRKTVGVSFEKWSKGRDGLGTKYKDIRMSQFATLNNKYIVVIIILSFFLFLILGITSEKKI